ncbi:type IX secretion system membrane protein PorP/SprF [Cytophagaceae bacterium ABcell3]|nr:type IX secretion system membrane protein PorP/SprF [Cytophagaceae bacterium ABcell3]
MALTVFSSFSQDVQFSQFYAVPTHLNPAFAGSAHMSRGIFHQRVQWPALDARYITSLASTDFWFQEYRSGVGIYAMQDFQGQNNISSTDIHVQYAYEIPVNDLLTIRTGLQGGYVSRTLNYSRMTFPDQFTNDGLSPGSVSQDMLPNGRNQFVDIGSGVMLYNDNFWFGYSALHMNRPNQSFLDGVSRLPVKHAFVAGYKFLLNHSKYNSSVYKTRPFSITPTVHYKFQGKSDQVDLGVYALYDQVIAGVWYRGIPVKQYLPDLHNNESMVVLFGYKFDNISISYSYDFVVSRLSRARAAGAHELNITYLHKRKNRKKPMKRLPCPSF